MYVERDLAPDASSGNGKFDKFLSPLISRLNLHYYKTSKLFFLSGVQGLTVWCKYSSISFDFKS